ncbi:hypothetical protein MSUIS_06650 [Mycoplasma suis KI3806]|uniref:Uncharacterized protein n=1 Tax=Mycoplasma suis (strain KI_3806) TaxID=708248 RepID=F0V277_MYCS3|nr:hypothetical protein [Mycoplasma suis]CBZ40758.1 hypothetical protein MSUIS_06650 [Mycoplasma suis KI3806]
MIGGIAAKALILAVGLGAGLGAGEIGSMYNYDETVSIYKENKWFDKMALGSISQGDGKGIEVGKHKLHLGGWEDNKRIGGNAKGGGKVGENDVDIIFTQNRFKKSDNGNNGSSGNNFGRTTKGVSNRHVCILLGKNLVSSGLQQTSSESNHQQISGENGDVCWNYSWWVSKQKANGGGWYDIAATGGNQSRVFLDSTLDPRLGVIELNPTNGGIKGALGRKGWVLGLKVDNPKNDVMYITIKKLISEEEIQ